ncbi:hypothetical protein J2Z32_001399 [Paenibacillus turicensis]|uniref:Fibronectin type-III domain-containing protein n=1 Tax=Paenibacillus turicensis TaxID=160487 RepID=A0ABS4FQC1_9BACL|nr:alpha/beta hydrolase [Paenibacillus turicensis]MBP1904775.1 hypothetical protein [Paenibacillus turicensis]
MRVNKSPNKFFLVFTVMILVINLFSDFIFFSNKIYAASDSSVRSTNVWSEKSKVEFGEIIKIHYNLDDIDSPVKINVYLDTKLVREDYNYNPFFSNIYTFSSNVGEGILKFKIMPMDGSGSSNETSVKVFKHRVVLIPGIMASEIYAGSEKVWIPDWNFKENIEKLQMTKEGKEIIQLKAGSPDPKYYKTLHDYLNQQFHVVDFGYDWRFGAKVNAGLLKNKINQIKTDSPDSKIFVVAHSMGGIIATEYINLGYGKNIDKLVTIGTPYLGAPKASYIFETGHPSGNFLKDQYINKSIKKIMPNILSAYELLPSKNYFSLNNTYYLSHSVRIGPPYSSNFKSNFKQIKHDNYYSTKSYLSSRKWLNDSMLNSAEKFHDNLDIINNLNSIDSYYIIGDKVSTFGGMNINDVAVNQTVGDVKSIQGDGTVPVISASVGNKLNSSRTYYIQEEHSKLPGNVNVQKQVENILLGNPNKLSPNIRKTSGKTKSLKIKIECPVDLNVYDSAGNHLGATGSTSYEENIPFGSYYTDGETKIALLNDGDYNVKLKGTGYGEMVYSLVWVDENDEEVKTVRFDEVNVTPNSVFTSKTNADGQIKLEIDEDGDGKFDQTIIPSVELDPLGTQDEIKPTIDSNMLGIKGVNEWYGKGAAYKLTGQDNESGIYKVYYDLNDSDFKEYIDPVQLPDTGIYHFKSFARDKNRNDSEILTETIKVDTTNPTVPIMDVEPLKWTNQFVKITLSGSQDADSGFQKYQYKIGENDEWKDYIDPIIIDTEGLHNVFARSVDNVFNNSDEVTGEAKVDKTNPTQPEGLATYLMQSNKVGISWSPSRDNVEVTSYDLYANSKYIGSTTDCKYLFKDIASNTKYTFSVIARDEAGNSSSAGQFSILTPIGLVAGENHSLQIKADGSVWAWGDNRNGQLGDGTKTSKTVAVQVNDLSDVLSVAAGRDHSLALKRDGTVWSWGYNSAGQIGHGVRYGTYTKPEQVENLTGVIAVMAYDSSSFALKDDGTVWAWGYNEGQFGETNYTRFTMSPVQVQGVSGVSQLTVGTSGTYALTSGGTVLRLSNNSVRQVPGLSGVVSIATRSSYSTGLLALKKDGSVELWDGTNAPTQVMGLSNIKAIAGGANSNFAISEDGSVWHWTLKTPTKLAGISEVNAITCGRDYVVLSKTDGSVWAYGSVNQVGQLGDGSTTPHTAPAEVKDNEAPKVTLVYPQGTKEVPEGSNVSQPSIEWKQEDAALTNFAAYQVEIMDDNGEIIVDSGVVNKAVTTNTNGWTVDQVLPSGKTMQVRVKVYDEQYWSEWSEVGWLKVQDLMEYKQDGKSQITPELLKDDEDIEVSLIYPIGTKDAPEESSVSKPSIEWKQEGLEINNFAAYQVQLLDGDGVVILDSGLVEQVVTTKNNSWQVDQNLPLNIPLQVRVRVYNSQNWSEWSEVGWLKVQDLMDYKQDGNNQITPELLKDNEDIEVSLIYPIGTKDVPEESSVSKPSIVWRQEGLGINNFVAYQVQLLDGDGVVILDSGLVEQVVTTKNNSWQVDQNLPLNIPLQVRVRVYNGQNWSEWSEVGWLKYFNFVEG